MDRAVGLVGTVLVATLATVVTWAAIVGSWHPLRDAEAATAPLTLTRPAATPGEATLLFAGDTAVTDQSLPTLEAKGLLFPFGSTIDELRGADVAVVNAEAPITDGGTHFPIFKDYVYRGPAAFARALADAGFDVVQLANNHAVDYGRDGLADTIANITGAGMVAIGAGRDAAAARRGVVVDVGGIRIGLLAYCERQLVWDLYVDQFARVGRAGVAMAAAPDLGRDIARLKARADLVVVSFHAGDNYAPPRASSLAWSRRAIDAGADLVVDHHPHVAHPIARYRGRPIVLSLGNYAFGTSGRFAPERDDLLNVGLLAYAHARRCPDGAAFDRVEILPLAVQNSRVHFRPEPLSADELARTLERLRLLSSRYGAELRVERGRALLPLDGCPVAR